MLLDRGCHGSGSVSFLHGLFGRALLAAAALIFLALHFALREKPKVAWQFEENGYPVLLFGYSENDHSPRIWRVSQVAFQGANVSGHNLNQVDASITLLRDQRTIPLMIWFPQGGMGPTSDLEVIPPNAKFTIGLSFDHNPNFPDLTQQSSIDQFMQGVGGFTLDITIDGQTKKWTFTVDDLRDQFERQKTELEKNWSKNPDNVPRIKRKTSSSR